MELFNDTKLVNAKIAAMVLLLGGKVRLGRMYSMSSYGLEVEITDSYSKEVARKNIVPVHEKVWVRLELVIPKDIKERASIERRFSQHLRDPLEPLFLIEDTKDFSYKLHLLQKLTEDENTSV